MGGEVMYKRYKKTWGTAEIILRMDTTSWGIGGNLVFDFSLVHYFTALFLCFSFEISW
jgi:hypothetical protein